MKLTHYAVAFASARLERLTINNSNLATTVFYDAAFL